MIEEQYVSLKTAKLAKEKKFNESCRECYEFGNDYTTSLPWGTRHEDFRNEEYILAPTQAMLARWLRETKKIYVEIQFTNNEFYFLIVNYDDAILNIETDYCSTYEEAMEKGLKEALKLI